MTRSCLKLRCPACKGQTRLSAEAFAELRRRPTAGVDHACEHCGHRFPATLAGGGQMSLSNTPAPPPEPRAEPREEPRPVSAAPVMPAAVPFAPKAPSAAPGAPPFGMLGERHDEAPHRPRAEAPAVSPPPFAAGAAAHPPGEKKSMSEWWKSQTPKRQWAFLACVGLMIGSAVFSLPIGEASAAPKSAAKKKKAAAAAAETPAPKTPAVPEASKTEAAKTAPMVREPAPAEQPPAAEPTNEAPKEAAPSLFALLKPRKQEPKPAVKKAAPSVDDAMGTVEVGERTKQPIAAYAVEGKGFVARASQVVESLRDSDDSPSQWAVVTPSKRYPVTKVRFHPDFPAAKIKSLLAKGDEDGAHALVHRAERSDAALLETAEAPAMSLKLARDLSAISGRPLEIVSLGGADGDAATFTRRAMAPEMFKKEEDGPGLVLPFAADVDAALMTKEGVVASFLPRRGGGKAADAFHPIVVAETLAELLGAK